VREGQPASPFASAVLFDDCALFVPVISTNTESRSEGYFRLEWKLAVDRSCLMADDQLQ